MKFPVKTTVALVVLGGVGALAFPSAHAWWKERNRTDYRQAAVTRGDIIATVDATGTVQPVLRVQIGSVVSGPIRGPKGAAESLTADTTGTNIVAEYDSGSGVLTLQGEADVAEYEKVLRSIVYNNTSETPNLTARVIEITAANGTREGNVGTTTVTMVAAEDASIDSPEDDQYSLPPAPSVTSISFIEEGKSDSIEEEEPEVSQEEDLTAVEQVPDLDLDADDSSGCSGADFAVTFVPGDGPVSVTDSDATLDGGDSTILSSLTATLMNILDDGKLAYYNQEVHQGELLAEIDPRVYKAAVARDQASLNTRLAEVERVEALLAQAQADKRRALRLKAMEETYRVQTGREEVKFISDAELDQIEANRASLEAQLKIALATVEQARGSLENSIVNLGYTKITSPVDGVVIDRKIDEGQTLAAQFQTPELFVIAPNMRERMHVIASVDEADIGRIREAERGHRPVDFTVDAYPNDLFRGKIFQVRMNPTTVQNVVTYPVVVEVANPDLKLLPGMTANLSFETDRREDIIRIPNAALRFYPQIEQVHPDDKELIEGVYDEMDENEEESTSSVGQPAAERIDANKERNKRHVWVVDGDYLRAIEVVTGVSDYKWTELISGDLEEDQELVTGIAPPRTGL
jgi:HlyD family secretion protein